MGWVWALINLANVAEARWSAGLDGRLAREHPRRVALWRGAMLAAQPPRTIRPWRLILLWETGSASAGALSGLDERSRLRRAPRCSPCGLYYSPRRDGALRLGFVARMESPPRLHCSALSVVTLAGYIGLNGLGKPAYRAVRDRAVAPVHRRRPPPAPLTAFGTLGNDAESRWRRSCAGDGPLPADDGGGASSGTRARASSLRPRVAGDRAFLLAAGPSRSSIISGHSLHAQEIAYLRSETMLRDQPARSSTSLGSCDSPATCGRAGGTPFRRPAAAPRVGADRRGATDPDRCSRRSISRR